MPDTLGRPDSQDEGSRQDIQNQKELDSLTSEAILGESTLLNESPLPTHPGLRTRESGGALTQPECARGDTQVKEVTPDSALGLGETHPTHLTLAAFPHLSRI